LIYNGQQPIKYQPSLTDLTRYLIALELVFEFGGKHEKYVDTDNEKYFSYLSIGSGQISGIDTVKGFNINFIGSFLMMVRYGFREYDFDYTKKKILDLQFEALVSSIVCLLNTKWKEEEMSYLSSLVFNCLHYFGFRNFENFEEKLVEINEQIREKSSLLKHHSDTINLNLQWYENRLIPVFKKTICKLAAKQFDTFTSIGQLIYKSPFGYCYVKDLTKENDFTLVRPGFLWDNKTKDFVRYNDNEVYRPIKLTSFIEVPM